MDNECAYLLLGRNECSCIFPSVSETQNNAWPILYLLDNLKVLHKLKIIYYAYHIQSILYFFW